MDSWPLTVWLLAQNGDDGLGKVLIGIVVAIIWIVSGIMSTIRKSREQQEELRRQQEQQQAQTPWPTTPGPQQAPSQRPSEAPAPLRRSERATPPPLPQQPRPQPGRQKPQPLRRPVPTMQAPPRPRPRPTAPPRPGRASSPGPQRGTPVRQPPARPQRAAYGLETGAAMQISTPGMQPVPADAKPAHAADIIEAGEIGSRSGAAAQPHRQQSLRRLLTGSSIRDAVVVAELLGPPKSLRHED